MAFTFSMKRRILNAACILVGAVSATIACSDDDENVSEVDGGGDAGTADVKTVPDGGGGMPDGSDGESTADAEAGTDTPDATRDGSADSEASVTWEGGPDVEAGISEGASDAEAGIGEAGACAPSSPDGTGQIVPGCACSIPDATICCLEDAFGVGFSCSEGKWSMFSDGPCSVPPGSDSGVDAGVTGWNDCQWLP